MGFDVPELLHHSQDTLIIDSKRSGDPGLLLKQKAETVVILNEE